VNSFLIIGAQRSGTSLLTRILNQHPSLAVPPESFFFNTFVPLLKYYGDLQLESNLVRFIDDVLATPKIDEWSTRPTRDQILERIRSRNAAGVFVALMESWAVNQGKTTWGEKTPHHVFYWPQIREGLPGIPLVHIIRDGRDVALGLVRARFGPKSVYAAAQRWRQWLAAIDEIREVTPADLYHQVTYEDLLLDPQQTIGGICRFLGLEFDTRMLEFHQDQSRYSGYAEDHANLNKPLLTDKVAGWRRNMRPADIRVFEAICSEQLKQYGYPVESGAGSISNLGHFFYRWIDHPPRKAMGMLVNRQGHSEEARLAWIRARAVARFLAGGIQT
jgi:LPS sulfotransferase NodH